MVTLYSTDPSPGLHPDSQWSSYSTQPHHCNPDLLYIQVRVCRQHAHTHDHVACVFPPLYQSEGEHTEAEEIWIMWGQSWHLCGFTLLTPWLTGMFGLKMEEREKCKDEIAEEREKVLTRGGRQMKSHRWEENPFYFSLFFQYFQD